MLGSLMVAQMDGMAYEGLDDPVMHGAVGPRVCSWRYHSPKRDGAVKALCKGTVLSWTYRAPKARWRQMTKYRAPGRGGAACDTEIMNKLAPSPFWNWLVHRLFAFAIDFEFALLFGIDFLCTSRVILIMGPSNLA